MTSTPKKSWEKYFDANWKIYLTEALEEYISSEGWDVNPKLQARKDYQTLKIHIKKFMQDAYTEGTHHAQGR